MRERAPGEKPFFRAENTDNNLEVLRELVEKGEASFEVDE